MLSCGGLAKRWLVPGWRCGWVLIRDQNGVLDKEIRAALMNLSMLILGANTLTQSAIPAILVSAPFLYNPSIPLTKGVIRAPAASHPFCLLHQLIRGQGKHTLDVCLANDAAAPHPPTCTKCHQHLVHQ